MPIGKNIKYFSSLKIALFVLLIFILIELIVILLLNSGKLIFTLDDAYIQLRMAENLMQGHYGINLNEPSSPSSSILWIFLLAPFAKLPFISYLVFLINTLCAAGTLILFWKILTTIFKSESENKITGTAITWILILLIFATNIISLIFIGMEHSLQIFLVTLIICGLFHEIEQNEVKWWLIAAIIAAPLIRYENFAVSLPAVFYLFFRSYYKKSFLAAGLIILLFGGFTVFLFNLNLSPLPASVKFKLSENTLNVSDNNFNLFIERFTDNPKAILLLIGMFLILNFSFFKDESKKRKLLAYIISLGILLHLLIGKYGSFERYEIYIYTVTLLSILYLYKDHLIKIISGRRILRTGIFFTLLVILIFNSYIKAALLTPIASNNIYEQQYQMHRFAVEYYKKPVAVNDLGYVAYQNNNYVLDLWGLSSTQALKYRANDTSSVWMDKITKDYNVKFAMIYDMWFENIPAGWIKLGELKLSKIRVTPSHNSVSFYAADNFAYDELYKILKEFVKTLPAGTKFNFSNQQPH